MAPGKLRPGSINPAAVLTEDFGATGPTKLFDLSLKTCLLIARRRPRIADQSTAHPASSFLKCAR
jgi:hypothetical protein